MSFHQPLQNPVGPAGTAAVADHLATLITLPERQPLAVDDAHVYHGLRLSLEIEVLASSWPTSTLPRLAPFLLERPGIAAAG